MTQPEPQQDVSRRNPRLRELAGNALRFAVAEQWLPAQVAVQTLADEFGGDGVVQAALLWIDSMLKDSGATHPTPVQLVFVEENTGEFGTADEVPSEIAWAGRLIAARLADDEATFGALIAAFDTDEAFSKHIAYLLQWVGQHYPRPVAAEAN